MTLAADQLTKRLVLGRFLPGESVPILPPVLHFTYVQNTGAAFGLMKGLPWLFIGLSAAVILWIGREFLRGRPPSRAAAVSYALLLGGAGGNLIDRLRFGHVVDFIDLRVWPVFNVADSAITIGVIWLLIQQLRPFRRFRLFRRTEGTEKTD